MLLHPCEIIYNLSSEKPISGNVKGTCRITGKQSVGILWKDFVRDTFTDQSFLYAGDIISNEAIFCFNESSELLQRMANRDKPQRFRTYSHIVSEGKWFIFLKDKKAEMFRLITETNCTIVSISDSGQRHLLFKYKLGFWQLEDQHVCSDIVKLKKLHFNMQSLQKLGFTQTEIITGNYPQYKILKCGLDDFKPFEGELKSERGSSFFAFASFFMYKID